MKQEISKKEQIKELKAQMKHNTEMAVAHSEMAFFNKTLPREQQWAGHVTADTCAMSHAYFQKADMCKKQIEEIRASMPGITILGYKFCW